MIENFYAIVLAAGNGSRMMDQHIDKLFISLCDVPVFFFSVKAFTSFDFIKKIIVVVKSQEQQNQISQYLSKHNRLSKSIDFILGGNSRTESVFHALKYINSLSDANVSHVVIHDAARPFVTEQNIFDVCSQSLTTGAAVLAKKTTDTIISKTNKISHIDRANLWNVETPQAFSFQLIFEAYTKAFQNGQIFTDESSALPETFDIKIVENTTNNLKLTYPSDITLAQAIMQQKQSFRVGYGYDIHTLVHDRKLILGGIEIPHLNGLLGHSDGDVLLHAISDALLGAAGLPDIGQLFPDTNPENKGMDSSIILKTAKDLLQKDFYNICNLDCLIIAQEPKLTPFINEMKLNIANILNCTADKVNIKAKTNEQLDSIGNCEAISAHVSVLISKIN